VDDCKHDDNTKLKNKKKKGKEKKTLATSRWCFFVSSFCDFESLVTFSILLHFFGVKFTIIIKENSK